MDIWFKDTKEIGSVLSKSTIKESMFTAWMDSNKRYPHGLDLMYAEYLFKLVYVAHRRCWQPRKQGYTIGRLIWVPPSSGKLFYMGMMLSSAKGITILVPNLDNNTTVEVNVALKFNKLPYQRVGEPTRT